MGMRPMGPLMASNIGNNRQTSAIKDYMEVVEGKGVTRYMFKPPIKAGANLVHKAEIVITEDYETINVYAKNGNTFSCTRSKIGEAFIKECNGNRDCNKIIDSVAVVVNRIKRLDRSKVEVIERLLRDELLFATNTNSDLTVKNKTSKPITLRRVFVPQIDEENIVQRAVRYTSILPQDSDDKGNATTENALMYVNSNSAHLEIDTEDPRRTYMCTIIKQRGDQYKITKEPYIYVFPTDPDRPTYSIPLNNERKKEMLEKLQTMNSVEPNPEYTRIIETLINHLKGEVKIRTETVEEKGVTRYFFTPPVDNIHKAEIVVPQYGTQPCEVFNVYTTDGKTFSCIRSQDEAIALQEFIGKNGAYIGDFQREKFKKTIPVIADLIKSKSKDRAKLDTLGRLLPFINKGTFAKNETGKPVTVRRVFYPETKQSPTKTTARYAIIYPDNSVRDAFVDINPDNKTARLYIGERKSAQSISGYKNLSPRSYTCTLKIENGQYQIVGEPTYSIRTARDFSYTLSSLKLDEKGQKDMLTALRSINDTEHNELYRVVIKTVISSLDKTI